MSTLSRWMYKAKKWLRRFWWPYTAPVIPTMRAQFVGGPMHGRRAIVAEWTSQIEVPIMSNLKAGFHTAGSLPSSTPPHLSRLIYRAAEYNELEDLVVFRLGNPWQQQAWWRL